MPKTATNKILVLLVVALLITNLTLIYYFTQRHPSAVEPRVSTADRQLEWIKKELQLTDAQTATYLALRQKRDSLLKPLNEQLRQSKMKMVELLRQPQANDTMVLAIAAEVTRHQLPIEQEYYQHFRRVQAMCTPEQLSNLDSMLVRMVLRNTGATLPPRDSAGGKSRR